MHEVRSQLDADLAAVDESLVLRVANSLWPQAGYPFRDEFLELVGRWYAAAVKVVDYIEAAEAARLAINTWVEEHTKGKVRDLVPPGGVDAMTRLVLVNAIYFYGTWVHQFDAASTRTGPFHLLDGQTREMPLMEQTDEFRYNEGDGWRAAQLPYRGQASMLVVAPDDGRFAEVEARFGPDLLAEVREMLEPRRLHLVLPRFELTCALELSARAAPQPHRRCPCRRPFGLVRLARPAAHLGCRTVLRHDLAAHCHRARPHLRSHPHRLS